MRFPIRIETLELSEAVKLASGNKELVLHYQPIVDLESGRIVRLEALVRWQHPELGLLGPGEFIGAAEENGAIREIGEWVIDNSCRQLKYWKSRFEHLENLGLSVNLSLMQLRSERFVTKTFDIVSEVGIEPSDLTLEVTESMMMSEPEDMIARVSMLRDFGISVAVDDFGIGYSSLIYVARLRLTEVKIDREFTRLMGSNPKYSAVTESIINLGRALDLQVTAEGVENLDQLLQLQSLGCHCVQGYLISKPLPGDKIEPILHKGMSLSEILDLQAAYPIP